MTTIRLPVPPSTNKLYRNVTAKEMAWAKRHGRTRKGRYPTPAYTSWIKQADLWYLTQKRDVRPITGPAIVEIKLPMSMRGDASNRIKAAEDWLVSRQITSDDSHNRKVSIEFAPVDCCEITVRAA